MKAAAFQVEPQAVLVEESVLPAPILSSRLDPKAVRRPAPPGLVVPPHSYTRREADEVFRQAMKKERVAGWRRWLAYRAVRWFGGGAWRG